MMLSLLHHQNLVNLVGYCADGDQRILVYEYMQNGSLEDHLLGIHNITKHHRLYSFCKKITSLLFQNWCGTRRNRWIGTQG